MGRYDIGYGPLLGPGAFAQAAGGGGGGGGEEGEELPIPADPGNAPPGTLGIPSTPVVEPVLAGYSLAWDGKQAGGAVMPRYRYVEVHNLVNAGDPLTNDTVAMQILGPTDVLVPVDGYEPVWVRLCAVNDNRQRGGASIAVQVKPGRALDPAVVEELKAVQIELDARLGEARARLAQAQTDGLFDGSIVADALAENAKALQQLVTGIPDDDPDIFDVQALMLELTQAAVLTGNLANSGVRAERVAFAIGGGNLLYNSSGEDTRMLEWPSDPGLAVTRQTGDGVHGEAYIVTTVS